MFRFLRRKPKPKPLTTDELFANTKPINLDELSPAQRETIRILRNVHRNGGKYIPEQDGRVSITVDL